MTDESVTGPAALYRHDHEGARVHVDVHPAEREGRFWRAYCPDHAWAGPWRLFRTKAVEDVIEHGV